jgi:hypothetical protein
MTNRRGSTGRIAIFALVGAVVAVPVPIIGPIFGLIIGAVFGYFFPGKTKAAQGNTFSNRALTAKLLVACGGVLMVYALAVDTSVPSVGGRVNNIGLMRDQQNFLIVSSVLIIAGVILMLSRQALPAATTIDPFDDEAASRTLERQRYAVSLGIERTDGRYLWAGEGFSNLEDAIEFVEAERLAARRPSGDPTGV